MKIDNYALTMFQTCPALYDLRMRQHWTTTTKGAALISGAVFHNGLAAAYSIEGTTKQRLEAALNAVHETFPADFPPADYRNEAKIMETMVKYFEKYPSEPFRVVGLPEKPMIEVSFTLDTGMFLSCKVCGPDYEGEEQDGVMVCPNCGVPVEPIEYGGIFDGLVQFGPVYYILEHKTTSQLGGSYFFQFKPNNQITGYVWAAGKLTGQKIGGAYVNAIGWYKSQGPKFERELTTRTAYDIEVWLRDLKATCEAIQAHERTGVWPQFTKACTLYGRCEFHDVHILPDANTQERWLNAYYVKQEWDYENRDDEGSTA